ncbi:hypothetical protein MTR67_023725 [Solanum verrucosum]|uniref:Uncharacterized protein n=1 Tax=Solanum verrucosum TaxID=315347 RepID=A0AAF0TXX3_SOLVR|nr:hypothetical protein MTR67_023725 [Solanum verrucosum]
MHQQVRIHLIVVVSIVVILGTSKRNAPAENRGVVPTGRDLHGMPLDRDINFCINLELSTCPISIPPYCMALAELRELKTQLQELLNNGFVRTSASLSVSEELCFYYYALDHVYLKRGTNLSDNGSDDASHYGKNIQMGD